jgi:hypothetical protein
MKHEGPYNGGKSMNVWNRGWDAGDVETMRARGIGNILAYMEKEYSKADMQRTFSDNHHQ